MPALTFDEQMMQRALELAVQGEGRVEPNPMVGALLVDADGVVVGEGYHERYGGPHAEVNAIASAGSRAAGATMYVTLEPCCHRGKTGPCTDAVIAAGVKKVFVGVTDPAPHASGQGISQLKTAGLEVQTGLLAKRAQQLIRPFAKWITTSLPYVHAKWAMSLDGKIATRSHHSQWISSPASREVVHRLRGRMDAVVVGAGTMRDDDPLLTARPAGSRQATRVVVTSLADLSLDSQLVKTASAAPVLVATLEHAPAEHCDRLRDVGVEVLTLPERSRLSEPADGSSPGVDLTALLAELGQRNMTNVLVEGGSQLLGGFFDAGLVDHLHVFIAPKIVGGKQALTPVAGEGGETIPSLAHIEPLQSERIGADIYLHGPFHKSDF